MRHLTGLTIISCLTALPRPCDLAAQEKSRDSSGAARPPWADSVRYGGGPSVGPPHAEFDGKTRPKAWCATGTHRPSGDYGVSQGTWIEWSQVVLQDNLSDTTEDGDAWRNVLGGAPKLSAKDSISQITDERTCEQIASILNREVLGWPVPPPVVVLRVRNYLVSFPANVRLGEFGMAVGMNLKHEVRGVATW